nr:MAG TPA: PcfJ like protein [Caudoviricetes sp.]
MKWVVINFDEDSKLYTVQDESGRVCRANTDAVVYGVKGGKLRSVPSYADQVLNAIKVYSLFKDQKIDTTDFGFKLLMEAYNRVNTNPEILIEFVKGNPAIVNDLESYAKIVQEKRLLTEFLAFCETRNLFYRIFKSVVFDDELTAEKAHKYLRSLIYFLNCDSYYYRKVDYIADNYDATIKTAETFKKINGIAFHNIDNETIKQRKNIAFQFMAEYPDFAITLVAKTYIDDLVTVFDQKDARRAIEDYATNCKALEIEPCLKGNILTLFANTARLYEQKKNELTAKALHKMAKRYEWLGEFSCNEMGVVIFETPEDFATEGETQHNCVNRYGYLEEMANGKTIICGVRKLDDIDAPYITCEVSLNEEGTPIGVAQYYRAFNNRPDTREELEFVNEFIKFIHNHK